MGYGFARAGRLVVIKTRRKRDGAMEEEGLSTQGEEGLVVVGGGRSSAAAAADRRSGNDVAKVQIPIGMRLDSRRLVVGIFTFVGVVRRVLVSLICGAK